MTNDELLTKNMELAGVIRSLRANAREDAERIERLERERDEAREALEFRRNFFLSIKASHGRPKREFPSEALPPVGCAALFAVGGR